MKVRSTRARILLQQALKHSRSNQFGCSSCSDLRSQAPLALWISGTNLQIRHQSTIAAAVKGDRDIFSNGGKNWLPIPVDPLKELAQEMKFLTKTIRQLLGSGHPLLDKVAKYYTQ